MLPLVLCLFLTGLSVPAVPSTPAGLWRTVDDRTHQPRGTVRIHEENGVFFGKIESSFDPKEQKEICDLCSDDRRNKPIMGLEILRGIVRHGDEYDGGKILDPETGSLYKCKFTMSADGEKLFMRGYVGVSLFGRSQVWTRILENR